MASSVFDPEIERFIMPIHGLYKEYIITVDELTTKNPEILKNKVVDTASVCDGYLSYELFGDGEEGEIVKEQVQTWICDNHLEVTNNVSATLRAKKMSFASWFRMSEENRSPDELLIHCLSKMSKRHTVIFNKNFPWSTLSNNISYNDVDIAKRSTVELIYVGVSKYAIIKPAPQPVPLNTVNEPVATLRKRRSTGKTTCRTTRKRANKDPVPPSTVRGCGKSTTAATKNDKPRTLAERRLNQYGIGNNVSSENSRVTRKRQVDYLKLNDGLDVTSYESSSPKSKKKKKNYVTSRSGPTTSRQQAQKVKTSSPVQEQECAPKPISLSDQTITEITAVTSTTTLAGAETLQTTLPSDETSGVHPSTNVTPVNIDTVPGVQSTLAGVHSPPDGSHLLATDDKLPDLVITKKDNKDEYSAVLDSVPLVGEKPPDHILDGATTEEEFDAVDALLSLSTPRDITTDNVLDENSSLMPVRGPTTYEDVNPIPIHLDQVTVDGAIAEIVEQEDILDSTQLSTANNSEISGIQAEDSMTQDKNTKENIREDDVPGIQPSLSGGQTTLQMHGKSAGNSKTALDCDSEPTK